MKKKTEIMLDCVFLLYLVMIGVSNHGWPRDLAWFVCGSMALGLTTRILLFKTKEA